MRDVEKLKRIADNSKDEQEAKRRIAFALKQMAKSVKEEDKI
jgi:hypothetical protein